MISRFRFLLLVLSLGSLGLLNSCMYMAAQVVAPNNCQKCEIVAFDGSILFEEEGCGGDLYNMKQRLKAKAFDDGCCDCTLQCETYKKDEENAVEAAP